MLGPFYDPFVPGLTEQTQLALLDILHRFVLYVWLNIFVDLGLISRMRHINIF